MTFEQSKFIYLGECQVLFPSLQHNHHTVNNENTYDDDYATEMQ